MTLFEEFKKGLKAISVEEVLDLVFYRPLAFVLVKAIYHTQITPNQLTLASMVLGIVGGAAYAFGTPLAFVVGAVFYLLYDVVDCSDGQLARLKHAGTPIGRILDGVADYTASLAAYVGIGIGYACRSDHLLLMWLLTAAAGFSNAIQSGLLDFYRNRYLDIVLGRTSILDDEQQNLREAYEGMKVRQEHAGADGEETGPAAGHQRQRCRIHPREQGANALLDISRTDDAVVVSYHLFLPQSS